MDQDRNHGKKCSVFNQIKYFFTRQVRMDARLLDFMQEHPEIAPDSDPLEAPPDEFQKILDEMEKRGIKPAVKRQIKVKTRLSQAGNYMRKPAFVALLVVLIVGGTSVGTSAKKAYDYRMRERSVGKSNLVWNNDQYILSEEDGVDKAYNEIEELLGIKPLKMAYLPFEMKFVKIELNGGNATIEFSYKEKKFYFTQAKYPMAASNNVASDRAVYKEVYNIWLDKNIRMEMNSLVSGDIEYSAVINYKGAYYYLAGIIDEDEFAEILKNIFV
ncbi:MAG: DUF4367 domain-containing protein [Hungatella hathewayi]|uniref:DUF4367 domain-containing protein n=1 Tax=Hungatella TaxID=1649459 RepID=UPI00258A89AD|nr:MULTISPECIES: DUF4367 domain-containing protein [Hungatella]MDY6236895.1 DUF4367 domain-containing protein [Hungatella hathewayi]